MGCSGWAAVAILGALVVLGLVANGRSLAESLVAIGFGAMLLWLAWLWQRISRHAETRPPLTGKQKVWNAAVFIALLAALGLLAWAWANGSFEESHGSREAEEQLRERTPAPP
jgi:hypothetical protein